LAALQLGARPGLSPLVDGLAVAARTGTLATRFIGTRVAGKLWAKTGSIDNAGGMVGVLRVTRPIEFALLINQPMSYPQLTAKEDQVVADLATYPEG
jgi:D-alanyl-D-alanine carboxypeptidase